jgi:hypothetical protein
MTTKKQIIESATSFVLLISQMIEPDEDVHAELQWRHGENFFEKLATEYKDFLKALEGAE